VATADFGYDGNGSKRAVWVLAENDVITEMQGESLAL